MLNNELVGFLIKWVLPIEKLLKYTLEKYGLILLFGIAL